MTGPVRACVSCRRTLPRRTLVRFRRRPDGDIVVAFSKRGRGRSAYLCPLRECFDRAVRRRTLASSLRRGGRIAVEPTDLWQGVLDGVEGELELLRRTLGAGAPTDRIRTLETVRASLLASTGGA